MAVDPQELAKYLTFNEGIRTKRYYDSRGYPTVGVGFNLARAGAREAIEAVGANFDRIKSGEDSLSDAQVEALLAADARAAIQIARDLFPDFDQYDSTRQLVLADLAFNLGETKLSGFKTFLAAVKANDWDQAAHALHESKWYAEVGKRAVRNIEAIRTGNPPVASL